jgi:hypothetical protein
MPARETIFAQNLITLRSLCRIRVRLETLGGPPGGIGICTTATALNLRISIGRYDIDTRVNGDATNWSTEVLKSGSSEALKSGSSLTKQQQQC